MTTPLSFMNMPLLTYIKEISPRPVLFIHGEKAHSRYFSETAYAAAAEPKELMIIPGASHVDLYDRVDVIPFDKLTSLLQSASWLIRDACDGACAFGNRLHRHCRKDDRMKSLLSAAVLILGMIGPAMAQDRIRISSDWGEVTADLADNDAAKALARMLPLTVEMSGSSSSGKDGQSAGRLARADTATRLFCRHVGALEFQSFRYLLSRRQRPFAGHHRARAGYWRRLDF